MFVIKLYKFIKKHIDGLKGESDICLAGNFETVYVIVYGEFYFSYVSE
jgi:hypothetical protein